MFHPMKPVEYKGKWAIVECYRRQDSGIMTLWMHKDGSVKRARTGCAMFATQDEAAKFLAQQKG